MTEREIARKTQIAWAINTKKDFCKVGKNIIPFDIVCDLSKASSYCTNVTANGQPVLAFGHVIPGMVGNAGSGIESGVSGLAGTVVLTNGSPTVTVGDKATVRNGDDCKMNCDAAGKSNVPGKIYTSTIQAQAARIEQNMWFSAREGLDGEIDRRYGPNYDRFQHTADEWNSGRPLGEQIKRVAHAQWYTIPDEVIAARQAVVNEANAKWATIDAMRVSPMAALFYLGGTAAGAEPETLDKLAQTGLAVGGIVGAAAAARGGVNPIRPPMQGERPLTQQVVRLPEPTQRPGIRPPPPQVNGVVVRTYTALDWKAVVPKSGKYKGEAREDHVRRHNTDDTTKDLHGVFKGDGVATTNAAWNRAQDLGLRPNSAGELIVPMGETVGISGGRLGTGLPLTSVRIIVQPNTNNIITSMPY
jgi:hypothetical protein